MTELHCKDPKTFIAAKKLLASLRQNFSTSLPEKMHQMKGSLDGGPFSILISIKKCPSFMDVVGLPVLLYGFLVSQRHLVER